MASKLVNRVAKLENNSPVGETHLVLPNEWWYSEEGCEPYETTEPFVPYESLDDWYRDANSEGGTRWQAGLKAE